MLPFYLLLAAATIRSDGAALRTGCDADAERVAVLAAGHAAEVKFALAGADTPCYKVVVQVDGRAVSGYVRQSDLVNLEEFDRNRQQGGAVSGTAALAGNLSALQNRAAAGAGVNSELRTAIEAMEGNQPARAMAILEPVARNTRDVNVLTLAGVAAWRNDEPAAALDYWKRALTVRPDPDLERLYAKVERESAADRSTGRIVGMRVLLRYETDAVDPETARAMALALDTEFSRISMQLGCATPERLVAIVQTREAYLRSSGAAEWSGGVYDGRIRVALIDETSVGPRTRRAFAHELVHACLANIGRFPSWLHEGIAQRLSGDQLTPAARKRIEEAIAAKRLPKLDRLDLQGTTPEQARIIYGLTLYAVDLLFERHSEMGIRNLLANGSMLAQITGELNRELGL